MPYRKVSITSSTNTHALMNYTASIVVGAIYTTSSKPRALVDLWGYGTANVVMTLLMIAGVAGLGSALFGSRMRDPSKALEIEALTLIVQSAALGLLVASILYTYGVEGRIITVTFISFNALGCIGRLIQASIELWRIREAKKEAKKILKGLGVIEKE